MNTSGEVADLMVKEGIQITEATVKLMAVGAKELTALLLALLNDEKKLQGKTNLKNLLKSEKPLCILQIKEKDLSKFSAEAKKYGVLFTAVTDKSKKTEFCDIIAKQEDVAKVLSCTKQAYGNYENGKRNLPLEQFKKLCEFYGVSADYILGLPKNLKYPKN